MRALQLDFQRPARASAFGWVILVAAAGVLAGLVGTHRMLTDETSLRRAAVQRVEAQLPGAGSPRAQGTKDDAALAAARQIIDRSKLPWAGLFTALESADDKDVALLAVAPDVPRRLVKIHAEARNLASMLAFHRRLQQSEALAQVVLVDHVVNKESPEAPVRFHLVATWGVNHGRP